MILLQWRFGIKMQEKHYCNKFNIKVYLCLIRFYQVWITLNQDRVKIKYNHKSDASLVVAYK